MGRERQREREKEMGVEGGWEGGEGERETNTQQM